MTAHILIVDDEKSLRLTFEKLLEAEGYQVSAAKSCDEALQLINEHEFDAIFTDLILGGKTGVDLLREVGEQGSACPVIMVTGMPDIDSAADAVRLGAFDYLCKPVMKEDLLNAARRAVRYNMVQKEKAALDAQVRGIFRSVKDPLITIDKELRLGAFNEAAARLLELNTAAIGEQFSNHPVFSQLGVIEMVTETMADNKDREISRREFELGKHGKKVLSMAATPLTLQDGTSAGVVLVIHDETRLHDLERHLKNRHSLHNLIGKSSLMQEVYALIEDMADVPTTALILGESGTGKELVADALHYTGVRRNRPLVKVNCSALSDSLLESELFGHVRGAFTGAITAREGRFQKADGGTIFLDEIGDISPRMQLRLLRVLQEKQFERVGDSMSIDVDIRIIAATNQALYEKVRSGNFREDLYYRLKVVTIDLPSLRERRDDIPLLTEHFCSRLKNDLNKPIDGVSDDVMGIFMDYDWPGNVRELQHVLEYAFIRCHAGMIDRESLPPEIRNNPAIKAALKSAGPEEEKKMICDALRKVGGNKAKAARLLGMDRKTLYRKIGNLAIDLDSEID